MTGARGPVRATVGRADRPPSVRAEAGTGAHPVRGIDPADLRIAASSRCAVGSRPDGFVKPPTCRRPAMPTRATQPRPFSFGSGVSETVGGAERGSSAPEETRMRNSSPLSPAIPPSGSGLRLLLANTTSATSSEAGPTSESTVSQERTSTCAPRSPGRIGPVVDTTLADLKDRRAPRANRCRPPGTADLRPDQGRLPDPSPDHRGDIQYPDNGRCCGGFHQHNPSPNTRCGAPDHRHRSHGQAHLACTSLIMIGA